MSTDPTGMRPSPDAAGADSAPQAPPARGATPAGRGRSSRRGRKVRKVHRVVRHLDVWSVAKVATLFAACGYVVGMISGYLLWRAADRVGTIDGIEGFFEDAGGYDSFEILGDVVFRSMAIAGLLLAGLTVFVAVLGAVLFNLISDLTGGIRMTVIDEDLIVAPARRRPSPDVAGAGPQGAAAPPLRPDGTPARSQAQDRAPAASRPVDRPADRPTERIEPAAQRPASAPEPTAAYRADR